MITSTIYGTGLNGDIDDYHSLLNIRKEQERPNEFMEITSTDHGTRRRVRVVGLIHF